MSKEEDKVNNESVNHDLAEISSEEMARLYEETLAEAREGSIVKGIIIDIKHDEVLIDIGYKSEGAIPAYEFKDISRFKVGDEVDVYLESKEDQEGMVVLSKFKAERLQNWERIISSIEQNAIVKGRVARQVKGGLMVDIGVEAFLPASHIALKHPRNLDSFIGSTFDFKVLKVNSERKNIVISRREILEEERAKAKEKLLGETNVGDIIHGKVKNITDFGAFIDLVGLDGLLHITDMTWGRISHPSELFAVGDDVDVMVLSIDHERNRISLGLKQKTPNPWIDISSRYPVGSKIKGRVVNILPYGAFVELEEGVEGLVHISEMSWTRKLRDPSDILAIGDVVEAVVLSIDEQNEKISLGLKQLEANPWMAVAEKYPVGTKIRGKVRNITSYGAFVEIEGGIDGLIHLTDMSWGRKISHPSEAMKKGEIIEAIVVSVDSANQKIALGLKQLQPDPWDMVREKYRVGDVVTGTVSKITGFGAFVELEAGVEGLLHISQVSTKPVRDIHNLLEEGAKVTARIMKTDPNERRIALSVREYLRTKKSEEELQRERANGQEIEE
ncbi:MAG: 30S ribosomal protein S1 [Candidatus Tritonobacter lacicola]|nr:30S ribosomal protein S1 [Candidatus Tritonobacter lacicola]